MSLVNDLLRDLADQQQGSVPPAQDSQDLLAGSSLFKASRRSWLPGFIILCAVIVIIFSLYRLLWTQSERPDSMMVDKKYTSEPALTESPSVLAVVTIPVNSEHVKNILVVDSGPSTDLLNMVNGAQGVEIQNHVAELPTKQTPELPELTQARIEILLIKAERALTLDRLTSPIEDNAYRYYQEILALSPQHPMAEQGLQSVAQRYVDLAQDFLEQGDYQKAEALLSRAKIVVPEFQGIVELESKLNKPLVQTNVHPEESNFVSSHMRMTESNAQTDKGKSDNSSGSSDSVAIKTLTVVKADSGSEKLDVKLNPGWQDQQAVAQAEMMLAQGQSEAAQLFMEKFIRDHQQPVKTTQLLFNAYLQSANQDAARLLLQQGHTYLSSVDESRMTAQLLVAQGDFSAAISALEKNIQLAENDEVYRALLAGLYHKTSRYQESSGHYRRLLEVFGQKPAYWLGLALALDALQQRSSALEAYRHIPISGALQPEVKDYVEQRIAALSH